MLGGTYICGIRKKNLLRDTVEPYHKKKCKKCFYCFYFLATKFTTRIHAFYK